jgi:hypothetical protein
MASHTKANGWTAEGKVSASKSGQMAPSMKDSGRTIRPTGRVNCIMLTEMFMKVSGSMIRLVDRGLIRMKMGPNMLGSGRMISRMGLGFSSGSMGRFMKASTKMVPKQERES